MKPTNCCLNTSDKGTKFTLISLIQQHETDTWREHLNKQWDYKQHTHHTLWKITHRLNNNIKASTQPKNNTKIITKPKQIP